MWLVLALAVGAVGCGSDPTESAPTTTPTIDTTVASSTTEVTTTTAVGPTTYVVVQGDALLTIASRHCVAATELVAANGWPDQLDHAIFPGDTIALPAGACQLATAPESPPTDAQPPPSTELSETNPYLARYIDEGLMTDPFYPDIGEVDFGPTCYDAYWAAHDFAVSGLSKGEFIAGLDPLPGDIPSQLIEVSEQWAAFSEKWYPIYLSLVARASKPDPSDIDGINRALLSDSSYLELLAAHENAVGQFDGMNFVRDLCNQMQSTEGSTP